MKVWVIFNWMVIGMVGVVFVFVLGGFMVDGFGWCSVFLVNVLFGVIVWLLMLVGVDEL